VAAYEHLTAAGHALYISPTKHGGFCYEWTGEANGCELKPVSLLLAWESDRIVGAISGADASAVEVEFSDGTTAVPRVFWTRSPMNAGFFVLQIPRGKTVIEVIANNHGHPGARVPWYAV
jgi:hypothetical protein